MSSTISMRKSGNAPRNGSIQAAARRAIAPSATSPSTAGSRRLTTSSTRRRTSCLLASAITGTVDSLLLQPALKSRSCRVHRARLGRHDAMATSKQRAAAKRNVKKAQSGARQKQTLKNLPKSTKTALAKEANAVRSGDQPTREELMKEARRLDISGRSKMGKSELKRAVSRAK